MVWRVSVFYSVWRCRGLQCKRTTWKLKIPLSEKQRKYRESPCSGLQLFGVYVGYWDFWCWGLVGVWAGFRAASCAECSVEGSTSRFVPLTGLELWGKSQRVA